MTDRHLHPLIQADGCSIEQCDCGLLHVTFGALTIRLQPEVAGALAHLLQRAVSLTAPSAMRSALRSPCRDGGPS